MAVRVLTRPFYSTVFAASSGRRQVIISRVILDEGRTSDRFSSPGHSAEHDAGWRDVHVTSTAQQQGFEFHWMAPVAERLGAMDVLVRATPDASSSSIAWQLSATAPSDHWSLWHVVFPQVAVNPLGPQSMLFLPRAAGQLERDAWDRTFNSSGRYPSGWTSMQYMAAYASDGSTGLYTAIHDPFGSTKEIKAESQPAQRHSRLAMARRLARHNHRSHERCVAFAG